MEVLELFASMLNKKVWERNTVEGKLDKFPEITVSIMDISDRHTKPPFPYEGRVARVTTYR